MNREFKGIWIPKEIWLNKELKLIEKCFLVEIDSLDNESGCFASNGYFAEFFGISKGRCSQIIKSLEEKKMIQIKYHYEGKQIIKRVLNILKGGVYFSKGGCLENAKDNNTVINNTLLTYKEKSIKKENSSKPKSQQSTLINPKTKKEKVAPKRKKGLDFNDITWPPVFEQNSQLKETFLVFAQMRKECNKPYKTLKGIETKIRALAKDCDKFGTETVIGAIEFSTGSEYMGIFVQDFYNKKTKHEKQQRNNSQPKKGFYEAYHDAIYKDEPEAQNNTIDIDWDE